MPLLATTRKLGKSFLAVPARRRHGHVHEHRNMPLESDLVSAERNFQELRWVVPEVRWASALPMLGQQEKTSDSPAKKKACTSPFLHGKAPDHSFRKIRRL